MNDKILTIKKSTLVDIANEVRAKTGSTDLIKVADLDDAVANLQGGGGGVVEVDVLPEPYLYTPVPNSGYVEKAYFNTSLSIDQVVAELEKLTYYDDGSSPLLVNDDVVIIAVLDNGLYGIFDAKTDTFYFASEDPSGKGQLPVGWVSAFNGEIEVNSEVLSGTENDKIANLFYLNKQLDPEFNAEAIYKLQDGTMWMHEDGWRQLKKTKKLTIKNVAGCEFSVPFYIDAENMFDADGNANESEEVMLTFAVNETKTFYVGSSVVLKGDWYCGNPDTRANVVTSGFTIENMGRYDVITVTGDNASVTIQREEL